MNRKYYLNCLLLMVPVMAWNMALGDRLPAPFKAEIFWNNIPPALGMAENALRIALFILSFFMPLSLATQNQKTGLLVYVAGLLAYCGSWLLLIYLPDNSWSKSIFGFMAPAYTPLLWLAGIGLIGDRFSFKLPYRRWVFFVLAVLFLMAHNLHTLIVYQRLS